MAAQIAQIQQAVGTVQVIANQTFTVPGSTQTYQLRSQDPNGPYGGPMLQLLSGHYPNGPNEIALTPGLASELNLRVGDTWSQGGKTVVGMVQNPQSLLDEFALVPPGQVTHPTQVSVLFNASPNALHSSLNSLSSYITTPGATNSNLVNPSTLVLALATVGMLLIALVSIGGFTVLAQRRMRSLGMVESMGATDRNVRLVLEANGVIVGVVGAVVGFVLGLVLWLPYRPTNEQNAHHVIPTFALPWNVIVPAMVLAVVATFFAASYPARAITRVPVVSALAGRPAPPRQIHRSFVPGVIALVLGIRLLLHLRCLGQRRGSDLAGPRAHRPDRGDHPRLPLLPRPAGPDRRQVAHRHPPAPARHGALPGPLRFGPLGHQPRHHDRGDRLCRRGRPILQRLRLRRPQHGGEHDQRVQPADRPYLNSVTVTPVCQQAGPVPSVSSQLATVHAIASAVGATHTVELDQPAVGLQNPSENGRQWDGPIYLATPALLRAYGISPSSIPSNVDILSSRPGLAGSGAQLTFGGGGKGGGSPVPGPAEHTTSAPPNQCLAHPVVQEESQLPIGTSAPNTVITESALQRLHLASQNSLDGWLILSNNAITSAQLTSARSLAASNSLSVESKNDEPTSAEIVNWATVFGVALALGVLAMSVGLIRSETASELRTLTATGASSRTRRALTAVTAGGLAFLGALLGTAAAYVGLFGWFRTNALEGGVSDITNHVPWNNLFFILIAMPAAAVLIGWVLAGREPSGLGARPME